MRQKPKTSIFRGTHWCEKRKRWGCQFRKDGKLVFNQFFKTEIEAAMHWNAVVFELHPEWWNEDDYVRFNNPWDVRPNIRYQEEADGMWQRIDIDAEQYALVDNDRAIYRDLKDLDWFVHDGAAWMITAWNQTSRQFSYLSMHEVIFRGPCRHRNGRKLDNRMRNLLAIDPAAPESSEEGREGPVPVEGLNRPSPNPRNALGAFRRSRSQLSWLERTYRDKLKEWERWELFSKGAGGAGLERGTSSGSPDLGAIQQPPALS